MRELKWSWETKINEQTKEIFCFFVTSSQLQFLIHMMDITCNQKPVYLHVTKSHIILVFGGICHLHTCSLTDARMAEVVSVSEPSPFDAFSTGLRELVLSEDEGWSGTGIASIIKKRQKYYLNITKLQKSESTSFTNNHPNPPQNIFVSSWTNLLHLDNVKSIHLAFFLNYKDYFKSLLKIKSKIIITKLYFRTFTTLHLEIIQIMNSCDFCIAFWGLRPIQNYNITKVMNHDIIFRKETNKRYIREIKSLRWFPELCPHLLYIYFNSSFLHHFIKSSRGLWWWFISNFF